VTVTWYRRITHAAARARWTCVPVWLASRQPGTSTCNRVRETTRESGTRNLRAVQRQLRLALACSTQDETVSGARASRPARVSRGGGGGGRPCWCSHNQALALQGTAGAALACGACGASRGSATSSNNAAGWSSRLSRPHGPGGAPTGRHDVERDGRGRIGGDRG